MKKGDFFSEKQNWFKSAKFGIFIHYGLYALHGGNENDYKKMDKKEYEKMIYKFNPEKFSADEWIKLIKGAGAKYLVITAKHGEGFCLWDTKTTAYKITNTPFKRDIIKELSDVSHKNKIHFGIYYSLVDWHYGEENRNHINYQNYVFSQLEELLTKYGRIDVVWFDGRDERLTPKFMKNLISFIHKIQPYSVVNDRGIDFHYPGPIYGDFITPERFIPEHVKMPHPFIECCDSMGQKSWGYHKNEKFWSAPELVKRLTKVVSLGGNYLLNIQPNPEGEIRKECVERMEIIGKWIKVNKESIFATEECYLYPVDVSLSYLPKIGVCTKKGNNIYIHLHNWPCGDSILIPHLKGAFEKIEIIGVKKKIKGELTSKGLLINELPSLPPDQLPAVIKVSFRSQPEINLNSIFKERKKIIKIIPDETCYLKAEMAELVSKNNVPYHHLNKWSGNSCSIGFWWRYDAESIWHLEIKKEGEYMIYMEQGANELQKDAIFEIEVAGEKIKGKTCFTGCYTKPERIKIGKIKIPKGKHKLRLKVLEMPNGYFADVYNIILQPIK